MSAFIDLTNQRFNRLVAIKRVGSTKDKKATWLCHCDCGNEKIIIGKELRSGNTQSCGCFNKEQISKACKKHDGKGTRLYCIWKNMRQRCFNVNNPKYQRWGGRGITICEEWNTYTNFRDWALSAGYEDKLSIDRIDNNGNYEPGNCRWATDKEQTRNARSNIVYHGKCLAEWCEELGLDYDSAYRRIAVQKWTFERTLGLEGAE